MNVAHTILLKTEPDITQNAVFKSFQRARCDKYVTELSYIDKYRIEDFYKLSTPLKSRGVWYFQPNNLNNIITRFPNCVKEEDFPRYAKYLLNNESEIKRKLLTHYHTR